MSKKKLFDDDSDEEISIKTENEYAKKYDTWREKEEIHKLEQKYGPDGINTEGSSSDSEDESDESLEVSEDTEAQFLKTLALLKTKDPRIYDPNFICFQKDEQKETAVKENKSKSLTFEDTDEDDDQDGDIFKIEKKAEIDDIEEKKDSKKSTQNKTGKIKEYLTGQAEHIDDDVEKDLAPLKALWSDPKLNEGEAFLRDYILNKRYLEEGEVGEAEGRVRDDDELEADEATVEEQAKFERAYNFRYEEPDEEYLKRFPRTMNYIRPKDDRRARKRAEVRARKEEEKKKKMEEIARLKALKLKEIHDKLARIKEVTGNQELPFKEEDIEGDFDPEEHDRRMQALFDEQFYGEADDTKPVFPDLDEELEIENWDNYEVENQNASSNQDDDGPHCEDDDFNMDADYDPKRSKQNLLEEIQKTLGKKRRNRKRQSKLSQILSAEKPKFLPLAADRTYAQHMEEYYKLDCEDIVGGMPTRFKYRDVVPNDFGLTVEEILLADDKELTQWVPLKKIVKYRPRANEQGDIKTYRQRAQDERLKKKLLPSLYRDLPQEPEIAVPIEETKKKKKKKKKKNLDEAADNKEVESEVTSQVDEDNNTDEKVPNNNNEERRKKKKSKHKLKLQEADNVTTDNTVNNDDEDTSVKKTSKRKRKLDQDETISIDLNEHASKSKKNKTKLETDNSFNVSNDTLVSVNENNETGKTKRSKHKNKSNYTDTDKFKDNNQTKLDKSEELVESNLSKTNNKKPKNKKSKVNKSNENTGTKQKTSEKNLNKKNKFKNKKKLIGKQNNTSNENSLGKLSDERLKAYGLNPKKYRGFLKYKKF